jgi:hypothetical protein
MQVSGLSERYEWALEEYINRIRIPTIVPEIIKATNFHLP